MEPLGTITKDFPFIDDVSRAEMESAMHEATDYWDFSNILGEKVCKKECHPDLLFFALLHSRNLFNLQIIGEIKKKCPIVPILKPFYFSIDESYANMTDEIENAIGSSSNLAVWFFLQYRKYLATEQGGIDEKHAQNEIEELIEEFKLPDVYKAYYYRIFGHRLRAEGNPEQATEYYQQALELSRLGDDRWHQSVILCLMGELDAQYSADYDCFKRTRDYLFEAREIAKSLNDKAGIARVLEFVSTTSFSRGSFSECIDCELEAISIIESLGGEIGIYAYNLSNCYSTLGEGENALEWARCTLDNYGPDPFRQSYAHMVMVRAYIALNRHTEAQQYLDLANELILQSGLDYALAQWHQTNGRLERQLSDLDAAMCEFQRAFEINQRFNRYARMRSCLHDLVITELELFSPTKENHDSEHSGPWMSQMDVMCEELDLPGYSAYLFYFKSELRMKQGRFDEASDLVDEVIEFTDNPSLRHIHRQAVETRERFILEGVSYPESKRDGHS